MICELSISTTLFRDGRGGAEDGANRIEPALLAQRTGGDVVARQRVLCQGGVFSLGAKNLVQVHPAVGKAVGATGQVDLRDAVTAFAHDADRVRRVRLQVV